MIWAMNAPLVNANWLKDHLMDPDVRVVDTRFLLGQPHAGLEAYHNGHIPRSVFLDLERHLSGPKNPDGRGGRHPLPAPDTLARTLGAHGIGNRHFVVAYDDPSSGQGFYAAHLWWLLRWLGHDLVAVLDGGLPAWVRAGGVLETDVPHPEPTVFSPQVRPEMLVDADVVKAATNSVLVDSRAAPRYRGEVEPLGRAVGDDHSRGA